MEAVVEIVRRPHHLLRSSAMPSYAIASDKASLLSSVIDLPRLQIVKASIVVHKAS